MKHKFLLVKYKLLIGFIALFCISFSTEVFRTNIPQRVNNKVLLIEYYKGIDSKVIKDYKRKKYRSRFLEGLPVVGGPYYNSYLRTLDVDGTFKLSDSAKIIFWENDAIEISLPFHYSDIVIDSLINDSVFQFTYLRKKHILKPGQIFNDTVISYEHEGKRLLKYITTYKIQNHGLTSKKNITDYKERIKRQDEESRIRDSIDMYDLNQIEIKRNK